MALTTAPVLATLGQQVAEASSSDAIAAARDRWSRYRFTEIAGAVDVEWLQREAAELWTALRPVSEPVLVEPRIADGVLVPGMRYRRVDPGRPHVPERVKQPMLSVYTQWSLDAWGAALSARVEPMLAAMLDTPLRYDRVYFLLYEAEDYIGPHNDVQTGQRVNIQFPVTIGGISGLRVFDSAWHVYRDTPGLLRVLGPEVWHEVLPIVGGPEAHRLNISLRYWL